MRLMHQATCCADCPLQDWDDELCGHPDMPQNFETGLQTTRNAQPPDECPLRRGELLITLMGKP